MMKGVSNMQKKNRVLIISIIMILVLIVGVKIWTNNKPNSSEESGKAIEKQDQLSNEGDIASSDEELSITEKLEASLANGEPVWLVLGTRRCPACIKLRGVFNELENDYVGKITFLEADLDEEENRDLARRYKVNYVPKSVIYDKNGDISFMEVGYFDKDFMTNELNKVIE